MSRCKKNKVERRSAVQLGHLAYFELIGKLIGVALSGRDHLPANFSVPLLKELITILLAVDDLRGIDSQLQSRS